MRKRLAAIHGGCIHLALDIWTSPNGHSYVGVIGCWQEDGKAQRNVLDMVPITKRHTAVNISAVISALMKRLEIQEKVWFIASDNASTNTAMMQLLGKDDSFPRIEGEATQIRCFAHILNLVSEAILRPFNQGVKASGSSGGDEEDDWESEEEEIADGDDDEEDIGEIDPLEDNDMAVSASLHPSAAQDKVNEALIRRALTTKKVAYISASASSPSSSPPATSAPQPSADLRADSGEVGIQIKQLAWFARKLRYNGRLRGSFQETCALFKLKTPYSLIRDEHNAKLIPAKYRVKRSHKSSYKRLVQLLKPLSDATLKFSHKSSPTIADVVGAFEELDVHYRAIEDDEDQPLAWREAARRAGAVCATYYGLADASTIYYLAVLLHPNLRTRFMRVMKWETGWIEKAKSTLEEVYEARYRTVETGPESQSQSQDQSSGDGRGKEKKKVESFVERQMQLAEVEAALPAPDIIAEWCNGSLPLVKGKMVDALSWWWDQKRIGSNHGGLTDLALDVFAAPAASVDVERLFSKAGHHITPLRHRLKAIKLGQMVTVGAWCRESWIPEGMLANYHFEKQRKKQELAKAKRARAAADTSAEGDEDAGPSKRSCLEDAAEG
ncbi:unnamed protein product [Tilletia controversa]|nr:unnamed protein product [Tilletia controversa]